jgi:hypothetical protein
MKSTYRQGIIPEISDVSEGESETFAEWQFRVKPFLTARNKWIDENIHYISGPIEYKSTSPSVSFHMRPAFWLDENWEAHWDDE